MYDAENVEFKFSRLRRHLNVTVRQYFSENDDNREFVPQSSSTLTDDISRTKANFSKIPCKPFSGLRNLAIEVKTSFNYCSSRSGQNSIIPVV